MEMNRRLSVSCCSPIRLFAHVLWHKGDVIPTSSAKKKQTNTNPFPNRAWTCERDSLHIHNADCFLLKHTHTQNDHFSDLESTSISSNSSRFDETLDRTSVRLSSKFYDRVRDALIHFISFLLFSNFNSFFYRNNFADVCAAAAGMCTIYDEIMMFSSPDLLLLLSAVISHSSSSNNNRIACTLCTDNNIIMQTTKQTTEYKNHTNNGNQQQTTATNVREMNKLVITIT